MMCLQYLFILFNLTAQPTVGIPAFTAEITHQYQLPLAACDTLSVTTKTGQNDLSRSAFHPSQAHLVITTEMVETALEILHPEQKTHTHERLGTLKNALRGPPPLAWGGTRIGSYVYGRYELDSSVAPKKGNVSTGAGRDHVAYEGVKGGKPYSGSASAPEGMFSTPEEIIDYRYGGNFDEFGGIPPRPVEGTFGKGVPVKAKARGMEQLKYQQNVDKFGKANVANKQNPVGPNNKRLIEYMEAVDGVYEHK